jgi:L-ascorbate metabolism protein UlaG (beta-lactamase superfamily)
MTHISRRALLAGTATLVAAGGLEAASLGGAFDHRGRSISGSGPAVRRALAQRGNGIVHIGHSTHVIEVDGLRVLTDPWFSDPAFGALAHTSGPACDLEELADLDVIAVSHEHPDHADLVALDRFAGKSRVSVLVATEALRAKLRARGFREVTRLVAWESVTLRGVAVQAVPALHDVPEVGFVVGGARARVYFAGDTGLQPAFREIRERCQPTFALLPVDGTRLRGSERATLDAVQAARVVETLGVTAVMPSHADARFTDPFAEHVLTATSPDAGAARFARELARSVPGARCHLPQPAERVAI